MHYDKSRDSMQNDEFMRLNRQNYHNKVKRDETVTIVPSDRKKIHLIGIFCMVQCIAFLLWAISILRCVWSPDIFNAEFVKIATVMYLYDYKKCGVDFQRSKSVKTYDLQLFKNETKPTNVKPIKWSSLPKSTSTRLTSNTRKYIEISLAFHGIWLFTAIVTSIFVQISKLNFKFLKLIVSIFMYTCICMAFFDASMAIVYIAHIQQSLTRSMVLRYAGWAIEMKIKHPDDFAGWIPMIASAVWLRGVIFWFMNIMCIKTIWYIKKKIKKKEIIVKVSRKRNAPIPENLYQIHEASDHVLVYHP